MAFNLAELFNRSPNRQPALKRELTFDRNESTCLDGFKKNRSIMAKKVTSTKAASAASKVLRDKRTSQTSKTAAGSALSQREKPKPKPKKSK